jgi:hypothetical protein
MYERQAVFPTWNNVVDGAREVEGQASIPKEVSESKAPEIILEGFNIVYFSGNIIEDLLRSRTI